MKKIKCIGILILLIINYGCQNEKFYKVDVVRKVNGEPMRGSTLMNMEDLINKNIHISKIGDTLKFEYPRVANVLMDTLSSFTYEKYDDSLLVDSIYAIEQTFNSLIFKFNYALTSEKDKRFEFCSRRLTIRNTRKA